MLSMVNGTTLVLENYGCDEYNDRFLQICFGCDADAKNAVRKNGGIKNESVKRSIPVRHFDLLHKK